MKADRTDELHRLVLVRHRDLLHINSVPVSGDEREPCGWITIKRLVGHVLERSYIEYQDGYIYAGTFSKGSANTGATNDVPQTH